MPSFWILKTEPSTYSYSDLERQKRATWDGVRNAVALRNIRSMKPGDRALIYHTGDEKAVVGQAEIVSEPYADPKAGDPKLWVVDIAAAGRLAKPVTLAAIKADPAFKDLALVRMGRLSVVPATAAQWSRLLTLAGK